MSETKPMSWPVIIGIMIATAVVTGLIVGSIGLTQSTAAVGASTGAVGGFLIAARRRALTAKQ